jgi:hypothetical protein
MGWRWAWRVGVSSAADDAATTGVVAGMHAHAPSLARARARPCSSVPAHAVVHPPPSLPSFIRALACSSLPVPVCPHSVALAGSRAYRCSFVLFAARPCPLPLVRARLHSFAGPRLSPPICVRSVVLVPVRLCCPRYLVVLVGVRLGSFVLVWLLFALIWASSCSFML